MSTAGVPTGLRQERSYSVVADKEQKIVVCRAKGSGIGLMNAMLSIAVQQSFVYSKPIMVLEDDKPFRIVDVRVPRDPPKLPPPRTE